MKNILTDPRSGLGRTEVNSIFTRLMQHDHDFKTRRDTVDTKTVDHLIHTATRDKVASITIEELEELIFETRKESIVRGFLEDFNQGFIKDRVIGALKPFSHASDDEEDIQEWVHCRDAYKALLNLSSLRLRRSQLMAIFTFAECYDDSLEHVELIKFANFASTCVENLVTFQSLQSRALTMRKSKMDDNKCMNDLAEDEVVQIVKEALVSCTDETIRDKDLMKVLQNMEKFPISGKEAAAIVASTDRTPQDESMIVIEDFISTSYHLLLIICRERYISRRQGLLDHRVTEGDLVSITSVVERLFEVMKLKHENDGLEISF